jgi:hypothetical protein
VSRRRRVSLYLTTHLPAFAFTSSVTLSQVSNPFGGVGDSGFGREGGISGLDEYMTDKLFVVGCQKSSSPLRCSSTKLNHLSFSLSLTQMRRACSNESKL